MNKEQRYDRDIYPLMTQIVELCGEHKIAMFATFSIPNDDEPDLLCTTHLPDESGELPDHIEQCRRIVFDSSPPLMLRTKNADGSQTLTAIIG